MKQGDDPELDGISFLSWLAHLTLQATKEAAPYIIWGILVFSFGLEGVVGLVYGEILVAAVSFVGMGAVIAAALHWNQLKDWASTLDARWVVVSLFIALVSLPASAIADARDKATLSWLFLTIAVIAVIAAVAVFFVYSHKVLSAPATRPGQPASSGLTLNATGVVWPAADTSTASRSTQSSICASA